MVGRTWCNGEQNCTRFVMVCFAVCVPVTALENAVLYWKSGALEYNTALFHILSVNLFLRSRNQQVSWSSHQSTRLTRQNIITECSARNCELKDWGYGGSGGGCSKQWAFQSERKRRRRQINGEVFCFRDDSGQCSRSETHPYWGVLWMWQQIQQLAFRHFTHPSLFIHIHRCISTIGMDAFLTDWLALSMDEWSRKVILQSETEEIESTGSHTNIIIICWDHWRCNFR